MDFPSTQRLPECDDSFISDDANQEKNQVGMLEITSTEAKLHNILISVYPVYEGDNVIGRHDNCDISIPSGVALSKKHACIEAEKTMSFIYDCGSSNKTMLRTLKLKPNIRYSLNDGDQLTLANIKFTYKTLSTELCNIATPQSKKHNISFLEIAETPTSDLVERQYACNKRSRNFEEIPDSQPGILNDSLTHSGNKDSVAEMLTEDNSREAKPVDSPFHGDMDFTDAETQRYDKTSESENYIDSDSTDIDSSNVEDSFTVEQTQAYFSKPQIAHNLSDTFCMLETQQFKHTLNITEFKNTQINDPIDIKTQAFINEGSKHKQNKKESQVMENERSDLNSDEEYSLLPSLQSPSFTQSNMPNKNSEDLIKSGPEINSDCNNDFQVKSHKKLQERHNKNVYEQNREISVVHSAKAFDSLSNLSNSLESVIGTEDTVPVGADTNHQKQMGSQGSVDDTIPYTDNDHSLQPGDSLISADNFYKSENSQPFSLSLKRTDCALLSEQPNCNTGKSSVENGVKTISPLEEKNFETSNVAHSSSPKISGMLHLSQSESVEAVSKISKDLNKNNVMQTNEVTATSSNSVPAVMQIEHQTMNKYEISGCIDKGNNVQIKKMSSLTDDTNTSDFSNNEIVNKAHIKYLKGTLAAQSTNCNTACRSSDVKLVQKVEITPKDVEVQILSTVPTSQTDQTDLIKQEFNDSKTFIKEDCFNSDNIDTQIGEGVPSSINRHSDNFDDFVATQVFASRSPSEKHLSSESVKVAKESSITLEATDQNSQTADKFLSKCRKTRRVRKCFDKAPGLSTKPINEKKKSANLKTLKGNSKRVKVKDKTVGQTYKRNDELPQTNNKMIEDTDILNHVEDGAKNLNEKRIAITNTVKIEPVTPTNDIKSHTSRKRRRKGKDDTVVQETPTISSLAKKIKHEGKEEDTAYSEVLSLRPRRQKPKVVFTGVVDKDGESTVCKLGGIITDDMLQCTHLVTDKIRRTVKFMCAMVRGIYIVDRRWLLESKIQSRFLPEENFQLTFSKHEQKMDNGSPNADLEKQYGFQLSSSLARANSRKIPLFSGLCIHVTKSVQPPPDQMYQIVECGGGEVLRRLPRSWSTERWKNLVVVSTDQDKKYCATLLKNLIPVVSKEFILTGILRQRLDVNSFRLFAFTNESNFALPNLSPPTLKSKTRRQADCDGNNNMNTRSLRSSNRRK